MADLLDRFAMAESGGNINARSPTPLSSAQGLYGFTDAAFQQVLQDNPDLAHVTKDAWAVDPQLQRTFAERLKQRHERVLRNQGLDVNPVSLYANWHFGEGGGPKFLKAAPDTPMEAILDPIAIKANPHLQNKTQAQVLELLGKKVGTALPNAVSQNQGTTTMNPQAPSALPNARNAYNPEDPVSVYNFIMQNQQNVPVQQLSPEQQQMLMGDRQQRASMLPLAIGASLAGDPRVSGMGKAMYADSISARGPQRLGDQGWITETGQVIKSPFAEEQGEQSRQDRALNLALSTANTQSLRRLQTENSFSQAGFTPDGQQVVTNRTGQNYVITQTPNGVSYAPHSGPVIPKPTFDKNVQEAQELNASAARSDAILTQVDQNPAAFGIVASGVAKLPQMAQGRAAELVLPPEALQVRTNVLRQAAQEISDLYGAALSMGEQARANTFIPNSDDPPAMVIAKLKSARDWAKSKANVYGTGVNREANARSGVQPQVTNAPQGGEERKSLNGKNYVKRNGQWFEE
jgi:hypothetical protein